MRPRRLQMQGFGAFREPSEVDLADVDLLALVGATGSGKSTIIDAITFALYGSVARYDDNKLVHPVINQTSAEARVALDFELGGRTYRAVRVVRRSKSGATTREARLERGDEVVAADARTMTGAVTDLLGLDVDQFNQTVVLPQGRFADFLHDTPAQRQTTLRQLLGLEMYQRLGQQARARAARCRTAADTLRAELAGDAAELTDEHRRVLADRVAVAVTTREWFAAAQTEHDEVSERVTAVRARLDERSGRRALLDGIAAPDGVVELDAAVTAAREAHLAAAAALEAARATRRAAVDAAAAGPDLATVRLQLRVRAERDGVERRVEELAAELSAATTASASAAAAADAVRAEQQGLDDAVVGARSTEAAARAEAASAPTVADVQRWETLHGRQADARAAVEAADAECLAAEAELAATTSALASAEADEAAARATRDALRERAGAAALAGLLVVGAPCPLCLQDVHELPEHHVDDEVAAAEARFDAAVAHRREATTARDAAQHRASRAAANRDAAVRALDAGTADLAGAPSVDELAGLRARADELAVAVATAVDEVARAVAAADAHRGDARHQATLRQAEAARDRVTELGVSTRDLTTRLAELDQELVGVAPAEVLEQQADEAERLAAVAASATADEADHEERERRAAAALEVAGRHVGDATAALQRARDRVAVLGPPAVADLGLVDGWAALTAWAVSTAAGLSAEDDADRGELDELEAERARILAAVRERCEPVVGALPSAFTRQHVGEALARAQATADADLAQFDERLARHGEAARRVAALDDEAAVADELARHLRADGFEGWLMQAALGQLVERATTRLLELSGGQYSLELDDRTFAVRDHANADEVRSARTLSGGETFLASLALALALAEATAELAPEGAPQIESIFLDEGFGTLDPHTLDTVASAIEELGASGRLVAVVTHIRELADRMPVRLEVTKSGGSSTVERVEI